MLFARTTLADHLRGRRDAQKRVIPAHAGIQCGLMHSASVDACVRRHDEGGAVHRRSQQACTQWSAAKRVIPAHAGIHRGLMHSSSVDACFRRHDEGDTNRNTRQQRSITRRGGILLEVLISIALFVGAASFVLGVTGSAISRQDVTLRRQQALDIARSLMASLEAGLITIADIRDGLPRELGSFDEWGEQVNDQVDRGMSGWVTSVITQRSEYPGLSLVEITVSEDVPGGGSGVAATLDDLYADSPDAAIEVTVRQLLRLREEDPEAWEMDELIEDLPETRSSGGRS